MKSDEKLTIKEQHMLTVLELRMQQQENSLNAIENKAGQYVNLSGLIFAIIVSVSFVKNDLTWVERLFAFSHLIVFGWIVFYSVKILSTTEIKRPVDDEWFNFVKTALNKPYHERMIDTYQEVIHHTENTIIKFGKNATYAFLGILVQFLLLVILLIFELLTP